MKLDMSKTSYDWEEWLSKATDYSKIEGRIGALGEVHEIGPDRSQRR